MGGVAGYYEVLGCNGRFERAVTTQKLVVSGGVGRGRVGEWWGGAGPCW